MATEVIVSVVPNCDICSQSGKSTKAYADGKTDPTSIFRGQWANMCYKHFQDYVTGLGEGRGKKMIRGEAASK